MDFEEFVIARGAALLRLATMLTGDPHSARDLVQSALATCLRHWSRVEAARYPDAYVRQVLVREHLTRRRLRSSQEAVVSDQVLAADRTARPAFGVGASAAQDPGDTVSSREAAWQLLARLPRRQRTVLALRYFEDLSDAEIATVMACSQATVRSNAARALATLRALVPLLNEELLP